MNRRAFAHRPLAASALALVLTLVLALPGTARADENADTAAQLFRSASAAFARGEYRAAAIGFEEANRRVPHASTLYNAALAWSAAGEKARVAGTLRAALSAPGLTPQQEREIHVRLDPLETELARVRVEGPPGARVWLGHVQGGPLPALIHVAPGSHEVAIERADGTRQAKRVTVAAGEEQALAFEAPRVPEPLPAPVPPPSLPPPDEAPSGSQRVLGWVGLGGAACAFGAGVALGVSALNARDEFEASGRLDVDAHDKAARLRTWTNVVWAGAGVLGVTGVVLLVTAPSEAAKPGPTSRAPTSRTPTSRAPTSAIRLGPGTVRWEARF